MFIYFVLFLFFWLLKLTNIPHFGNPEGRLAVSVVTQKWLAGKSPRNGHLCRQKGKSSNYSWEVFQPKLFSLVGRASA